jgi:hypothetical protein
MCNIFGVWRLIVCLSYGTVQQFVVHVLWYCNATARWVHRALTDNTAAELMAYLRFL